MFANHGSFPDLIKDFNVPNRLVHGKYILPDLCRDVFALLEKDKIQNMAAMEQIKELKKRIGRSIIGQQDIITIIPIGLLKA